MTDEEEIGPKPPLKEPEGYEPPTSAKELVARYSNGERLFSRAELAGADLSNLTLQGADLYRADLSGAKLENTNLNGANLTEAVLKNADLNHASLCVSKLYHVVATGARFSNATLQKLKALEADFRGCDFSKADLSHSELPFADLTGANLNGCNLQGATLQDTICTGARIDDALLAGVKLLKSDLRGVDLSDTNLYKAQLLGTKLDSRTVWSRADLDSAELKVDGMLRFDENSIRSARMAPNMKDDWSTLRRTYTGTRLLFHVLFLIAFALPLVGKAMFWVGVNKAQQVMVETVEREHRSVRAGLEVVRSRVSETLEEHPELNGDVSRAIEGVERRVVDLRQRITPCLAEDCEQWRVWQLLLGLDREWHYATLAGLLVLYNLFRYVLTVRVGPLREEEERSHYTPALKEYRWLGRAHVAIQVLFWFAVVSLLSHAYLWLLAEVSLPAVS